MSSSQKGRGSCCELSLKVLDCSTRKFVKQSSTFSRSQESCLSRQNSSLPVMALLAKGFPLIYVPKNILLSSPYKKRKDDVIRKQIHTVDKIKTKQNKEHSIGCYQHVKLTVRKSCWCICDVINQNKDHDSLYGKYLLCWEPKSDVHSRTAVYTVYLVCMRVMQASKVNLLTFRLVTHLWYDMIVLHEQLCEISDLDPMMVRDKKLRILEDSSTVHKQAPLIWGAVVACLLF